nr:unnamed protein product [Callosobruchus analis]
MEFKRNNCRLYPRLYCTFNKKASGNGRKQCGGALSNCRTNRRECRYALESEPESVGLPPSLKAKMVTVGVLSQI